MNEPLSPKDAAHVRRTLNRARNVLNEGTMDFTLRRRENVLTEEEVAALREQLAAAEQRSQDLMGQLDIETHEGMADCERADAAEARERALREAAQEFYDSCDCPGRANSTLFAILADPSPAPAPSLSELEGLGEQVWVGTDPKDYVRGERGLPPAVSTAGMWRDSNELPPEVDRAGGRICATCGGSWSLMIHGGECVGPAEVKP